MVGAPTRASCWRLVLLQHTCWDGAVQLISVGTDRTERDGPRRYLPMQFGFDTRANILSMEIAEDWEPQVREQWLSNQQAIREGLIHQHGAENHEQKIADFTEIGAAPWSILDEHNAFLGQVRVAFTQAAYYPALVGACALGERILNELILRLREDFVDHAATSEVGELRTLANWNKCIEVLVAWGVVDDATATRMNDVRKLRNKSVHFGEHLRGHDAREDALTALRLIQECVEALFAPHGGAPRFIDGTSGHSFLALASEDEPLVRRFFLPNCALVSPRYEMRPGPDGPGTFAVLDDETYQDRFPNLTDQEFVERLKGANLPGNDEGSGTLADPPA